MPQNARWAAGGAGVLLVLLIALYGAIHVGTVQRADVSILQGFGTLGHKPGVGSLANRIARLCNPEPYVYFCAIPLVLALVRRRALVAVAIIGILLGANATTELLKPLLAMHRTYALPNLGSGSWPSGHATAAMSLALCCVLAVPTRLRPLVAALGAAFAVAVSYSFLSLEWHYPSDVLGGFLVAATWTLLAIAAVWTAYSHSSQRVTEPALTVRLSVREALGPPTLTMLAAIAMAALVALARPHAVVSYARLHEAFVVGAVAIGALAMTVATGVMLALRR